MVKMRKQKASRNSPWLIAIAEELAIHWIIDFKIARASELKITHGFNQLDSIMTKQESIGLEIKKTLSNEELIEDFYIKKFDYMIDFYLPKRKLAIDVDELGYCGRDQITKNKRQKRIRRISWVYNY